MKEFFRVANLITKQGLWYDSEGEFTGLIHSEYDFCKNSTLKMPFCPETVGFLSATDSIANLFEWFPPEDIMKLQDDGFYIAVYSSSDYKRHNNHWLINQEKSQLVSFLNIKI